MNKKCESRDINVGIGDGEIRFYDAYGNETFLVLDKCWSGGITEVPTTELHIDKEWECSYCGRILPLSCYTCPGCGGAKEREIR